MACIVAIREAGVRNGRALDNREVLAEWICTCRESILALKKTKKDKEEEEDMKEKQLVIAFEIEDD